MHKVGLCWPHFIQEERVGEGESNAGISLQLQEVRPGLTREVLVQNGIGCVENQVVPVTQYERVDCDYSPLIAATCR